MNAPPRPTRTRNYREFVMENSRSSPQPLQDTEKP